MELFDLIVVSIFSGIAGLNWCLLVEGSGVLIVQSQICDQLYFCTVIRGTPFQITRLLYQ